MGRKGRALPSYNSGTLGGMGTDGFTTDPELFCIIFPHCLSSCLSKATAPLFWTTIQIFFFDT